MRTKTFIILLATLFFGGISTQVLAEDYRNLEELKLTTPTMENEYLFP